MTVTNTTRIAISTGNGATTSWPHAFKITDKTQLIVSLYEIATKTSVVLDPSAYTVSGVGNSTGSVLYPISGTPVASTHKVISKRVVPYTQDLDVNNQFGDLTENYEAQLDLIVFQIQQLASKPDGPDIPIEGAIAVFDANGNFVTSNTLLTDIDAAILSTTASADAAATSASNAATSASDASDAADVAAGHASDASDAAVAAGTSLIDFQKYYLGSFITANRPTVDLEGGALIQGALIWDETLDQLMVYNASAWTVVVVGAAVPDSLYQNMNLIMMNQVSLNALSLQGYVNGFVDMYTDETGVDTGVSTNETYDAAGDFYHNATTPVDAGVTAGMLSTGGLIGFVAANLVDGTFPAHGFHTNTAPANSTCDVDFGSGNAKDIVKWAFSLYTTASTDTWDISYSDDGAAYSTVYTGWNLTGAAAGWHDITWSSAGAHRYWRATKTGAAATSSWTNEITLYETVASPNMTLQSINFTAAAVPATISFTTLMKQVDAITLNTDYKAYATRDGGTNWSLAALTLVQVMSDGTELWEDSAVDVSGQPSGTDIAYKIETLNNKSVQLHGAVESWKP